MNFGKNIPPLFHVEKLQIIIKYKQKLVSKAEHKNSTIDKIK